MATERKTYMRCASCGHNYLGTAKCTYCGEYMGKALDDKSDDITKKTFDEPDLKKSF